jgi:ABC-2 type transport system ATP-binding protein
MNETGALEARGVAKRYGRGGLALDGLDLAVPTGRITALVGPNGAGKSTLMKAWVGFERPTRGEVRVMGIDPFRARAQALSHIGYVPQATTLYRELTVADHVDYAETMRHRFDRGQATRRLRQLAIPPSRRCGELSGGQQAQVALALALATHADVLILDEPLASLDPLARREFLYVLTDAIKGTGRTAVLSTHIVTDIEQACDHLVVLSAGRKLLDRSIADAVADHLVVAGASTESGDAAVGSFYDPRGGLVSLIDAAGEDQKTEGGRSATLEEVVLGYLASGRRPLDPNAMADES